MSLTLYAYETWLLILKEEQNLRMSKKQTAQCNIKTKGYGKRRLQTTGAKDVLSDLFISFTIVRAEKSMTLRWTGHVARTWETENNTEFRWINLLETCHFKREIIRRRL